VRSGAKSIGTLRQKREGGGEEPVLEIGEVRMRNSRLQGVESSQNAKDRQSLKPNEEASSDERKKARQGKKGKGAR